jgi:hypothetical protein
VHDWPTGGTQNFTARDIAAYDLSTAAARAASPNAEGRVKTYAADLANLTCGVAVVVRVRAHNRQGPGGPVWRTREGLDDAQLATPLCADGIEGCLEPRAYNWSITPRALVDAPPFAVPLSGAIPSGDGTDLELKNSFTKHSLLVTFGLPNQSYCPTANVTKWKVEWDTVPTFDSKGTQPLSFNATSGTSPEVEDRGDEKRELGSGSFNITGLETGRRYYVRVSAFNSLGYGDPADYIDAVPCVSADAPGLPTSLTRRPDATSDASPAAGLADEAVAAAGDDGALVAGAGRLGGLGSQLRATSLDVAWRTPRVDSAHEDLHGAGGDPIDKCVAVVYKKKRVLNKTLSLSQPLFS